jgi:uncharacterized membrane protein
VSYYEFLLFGHLLFVAVWVGTDVSLQLFALRARRAGPERMVTFLADVEWLGLRLLNPTSLLVLIFGVLLVIDSEAWELSQFWVAAGLAAFLASAITGAGFLGPETGRLGKMAEERGVDDPELQRRISRIFVISRIELVILVLIILDMVVKPGL